MSSSVLFPTAQVSEPALAKMLRSPSAESMQFKSPRFRLQRLSRKEETDVPFRNRLFTSDNLQAEALCSRSRKGCSGLGTSRRQSLREVQTLTDHDATAGSVSADLSRHGTLNDHANKSTRHDLRSFRPIDHNHDGLHGKRHSATPVTMSSSPVSQVFVSNGVLSEGSGVCRSGQIDRKRATFACDSFPSEWAEDHEVEQRQSWVTRLRQQQMWLKVHGQTMHPCIRIQETLV